MYCSRCGQQLEARDAFCSRCGAMNPANETVTRADTPGSSEKMPPVEQQPGQPADQTGTQNANPAYTRADYNPGQPSGQYSTGSGIAQKPGITGSIVFSIVNIVTFGFGISFILGIIALIFTLVASNSSNEHEARAKLQAAKTLNIVGLAIAILQFITIIAIIIGLTTAVFSGISR